MRKSIVFKFFCTIGVLMAAFMAAVSLLFYANMREAVRNEYAQLDREVLNSVAVYTDSLLRDMGNITVQLCNSSSLIEVMRAAPGEVSEDLKNAAENLVADYSWSREYLGIRFDIYALGFNGYSCSNFYKDKYVLEGLYKENWFSNLLEEPEDFALIDTLIDPSGNGPYRYVFQVAHLVRDHITGENLGVVLLNVSEKVLYDCYADQVNEHKSFYLVGGAGQILSAKDKRFIGKPWEEETGEHYVYSQDLSYGDWKLVELVDPAAMYSAIDRLRNTGLLMLLGLGVALVLVAHRVARQLTRPILELNRKMSQAKEGDLTVRAAVENENEIGQISASFNDMVVNMQGFIDDAQREERGKRDMELSFLRAQINPHFIYNTLNSIRFLIEMERSAEAGEMLRCFTRVLRRTLSAGEELLPLREELSIVSDYVSLQSIRYPGRFRMEYQIEPGTEEQRIPGFILQPIVENAIFYGAESKERSCVIQISSVAVDGELHLIVEDDGPGMSQEKARAILEGGGKLNSVGVSNVADRIQLCCGEEYGLEIESREGRGTRVIYRLPLLGGEQDAENRSGG